MSNSVPDQALPSGFYGDVEFRERYVAISYRAYCRMRDAWLETLTPPKGQKIVDIGCSTGEALQRWTSENHIVGVDHTEAVLAHALTNGYSEVIHGDFMTLDFGKRKFDALAAFGIVGCNESPRVDFERFRHLLCPGGRLYLIIAIKGGIRVITSKMFRMMGYGTHIFPRLGELEQMLKESDFEIETLATSRLFLAGTIKTDITWFDRVSAVYAYVTAKAV